MQNFKRLNIISGWLVFSIAAIVYLMTMEPTASFWDCGEFIAAAYKQMVGHPPGAPFFLIAGRIFTLFAGGNTAMVPVMINALSALASAFTILFLFWSITHLAVKTVKYNENENLVNRIIVIASGIIGALSYTFSDTFWFSAVEGEVYASSSLFTAVVFWAVLKWESNVGEKMANRWLVLIAYLMGLSIGVHLLNLLAIPAIVLIYYFKKKKYSRKGLFVALSLSFLILIGVMYIIIPGTVSFAAFFEKLFVNTFKLPFRSGMVFFVASLFALLFWGVYRTYNKQKIVANTILVCVTFVLIGYSSYAMILIRSQAAPPMNQNDPSHVFNFQSYLNREQYGDRPLFYGQYFNAPLFAEENGKPVYQPVGDKYEKVSEKQKAGFNNKYATLFPRMWSSQPNHPDAYMRWIEKTEADFYNVRKNREGQPVVDQYGKRIYDRQNPKATPSFTDNLKFFFGYQLGHMYFRYFMWNFAGRQNDMQSHYKEEINKGNWESGINIIDKVRLGNQDKLSNQQKSNKARNHYFLIPLLLGVIGLLYHYKYAKLDFIVVLSLFFFTGIAIVLYLNQNPLQPRERDYAYAGSFYAFCIWIGLAVPALFNRLKEFNAKKVVRTDVLKRTAIGFVIAAVFVVFSSPGAAVTIVALTLGLLLMDGLLWILSNVKSDKTIVVTLTALCGIAPALMAIENWDDHDRSKRYFARDFANNYLESCKPNAILFTYGDNDTFPLWYLQEVEGVRTDVRVCNLSYLNAEWYIRQMNRKAYESEPLPFAIPMDKYRTGKREFVYIFDVAKNPVELKSAVDWVAQDDDKFKTLPNIPQKLDYIPQRNLVIPVDSMKVINNGTVSKKNADKIENVAWALQKQYIHKSQLAILDMLSENDWNRPVYFAISVPNENYLGLDNYFDMQGMAYQFVPFKGDNNPNGFGGINTKLMYQNVMEKFKWGTDEIANVYLDENIRRMIMSLRSNISALAKALIIEGDTVSAYNLTNKILNYAPDEVLPYQLQTISAVENLYLLQKSGEAEGIVAKIRKNCLEELDYLLSLSDLHKSFLLYEQQLNLYTLDRLSKTCKAAGNERLAVEINQEFQRYGLIFQGRM